MARYTVVTGAAGMIGSAIVRLLNDQGCHELILVDDLYHTEKWKNLVGKSFADLISKDDLLPFLENHRGQIRAIFHLGACSDTTETDGDYLLENNYRYTIALLSWARKEGIRVVYASSAATYGDGSKGFVDDESFLESLVPLNMYGYSKHLVDLWVKRHSLFDQMVGLKYFNVFGPNEYHKGAMASMVLKMADVAKSGKPLSLFKSNDPAYLDGEQLRDFIYVKEAAAITVQAIDPRIPGGLYNVARGEAVSWNRLSYALFQALGLPPKIDYVEMPLALQGQYQNYTCADVVKLKRVFCPSFSPIEDSVADYVLSYLIEGKRW